MRKVGKIIKFIFDRKYRFEILGAKGFYHNMPDIEYLKRLYKFKLGADINLKSPKTFNEKLNWLKLYDRKNIYTKMADKASAKKIIEKRLGKKYVIPTLGVYNSFDEIDFDYLPNKFVIKCTHNSGGIVICVDKAKFNIAKARKKINHYMKKNYYYSYREWPYKNIIPRIIVEKYMNDGINTVLPVYKFFNFNNGPMVLQVIHGDKTSEERIDYFDLEWNRLPIRQNFKRSKEIPSRPKHFEEMIEVSRKLSSGFPFLRTDFYEIGDQVYFSEFTFYSDAGLERFYPEKWDRILGDRILLPK